MTDMKRIAIYCVTYNSYPELYHYLDSICQAVKAINEKIEIEVFVADNTDKEIQEIIYQAEVIHIRVFPFHQNLGYFGAIKKMMEEISPLSYNYTIISNVDIMMQPDTLRQLNNYHAVEDIGWIVPSIISQNNGEDLCPQATHRYSHNKLKFLWLSFHFPYIHRLYAKTLYQHKKKTKAPAGTVYAGHGSCIILTLEYFNRCGIIDYPVFLYEEEIYVAEECRIRGLKVIYNPSIIVYDIGKVSTGKTNWKENYRWHAEGLEFIMKKYY